MPHDRFYGMAAAEIAEHRPDHDLFARAYAIALGDAEKTKAIYIGIRAERLEEEALEAARRQAELEKARLQSEKERVREEAAARKKAPPPKLDPHFRPPKVESPAPPKSESPQFHDPEIAKAVQAMREALAASTYKRD